jgi:hypothetical protein
MYPPTSGVPAWPLSVILTVLMPVVTVKLPIGCMVKDVKQGLVSAKETAGCRANDGP